MPYIPLPRLDEVKEDAENAYDKYDKSDVVTMGAVGLGGVAALSAASDITRASDKLNKWEDAMIPHTNIYETRNPADMKEALNTIHDYSVSGKDLTQSRVLGIRSGDVIRHIRRGIALGTTFPSNRDDAFKADLEHMSNHYDMFTHAPIEDVKGHMIVMGMSNLSRYNSENGKKEYIPAPNFDEAREILEKGEGTVEERLDKVKQLYPDTHEFIEKAILGDGSYKGQAVAIAGDRGEYMSLPEIYKTEVNPISSKVRNALKVVGVAGLAGAGIIGINEYLRYKKNKNEKKAAEGDTDYVTPSAVVLGTGGLVAGAYTMADPALNNLGFTYGTHRDLGEGHRAPSEAIQKMVSRDPRAKDYNIEMLPRDKYNIFRGEGKSFNTIVNTGLGGLYNKDWINTPFRTHGTMLGNNIDTQTDLSYLTDYLASDKPTELTSIYPWELHGRPGFMNNKEIMAYGDNTDNMRNTGVNVKVHQVSDIAPGIDPDIVEENYRAKTPKDQVIDNIKSTIEGYTDKDKNTIDHVKQLTNLDNMKGKKLIVISGSGRGDYVAQRAHETYEALAKRGLEKDYGVIALMADGINNETIHLVKNKDIAVVGRLPKKIFNQAQKSSDIHWGSTGTSSLVENMLMDNPQVMTNDWGFSDWKITGSIAQRQKEHLDALGIGHSDYVVNANVDDWNRGNKEWARKLEGVEIANHGEELVSKLIDDPDNYNRILAGANNRSHYIYNGIQQGQENVKNRVFSTLEKNKLKSKIIGGVLATLGLGGLSYAGKRLYENYQKKNQKVSFEKNAILQYYMKSRDYSGDTKPYEQLGSSPSMPVDLSNFIVGGSPANDFLLKYDRAGGMSSPELRSHIIALEVKGESPDRMAPFIREAKNRNLDIPKEIQDKYNSPDKEYFKDLESASYPVSEAYRNRANMMYGTLAGVAGLSLINAEMSRKAKPEIAKHIMDSYNERGGNATHVPITDPVLGGANVSTRTITSVEDPATIAIRIGKLRADSVKQKTLGETGHKIYNYVVNPELHETLALSDTARKNFIYRAIGPLSRMPLTGVAAFPLMSKRVRDYIRGNSKEDSIRHKSMDWVEENPASTIMLASSPRMVDELATSVAGQHNLMQTEGLANRSALMRETALKQGFGHLQTLGVISIPAMFFAMRKKVEDAQRKAKGYANDKLVNKDNGIEKVSVSLEGMEDGIRIRKAALKVPIFRRGFDRQKELLSRLNIPGNNNSDVFAAPGSLMQEIGVASQNMPEVRNGYYRGDVPVIKLIKKNLNIKSPKDARASRFINAISDGHEFEELAKREQYNGDVMPEFNGHNSPALLTHEHNIVRSIEDKDLKKKVLEFLKFRQGEINELKEINAPISKDFVFGVSDKINRSQNKALERHMINRAIPAYESYVKEIPFDVASAAVRAKEMGFVHTMRNVLSQDELRQIYETRGLIKKEDANVDPRRYLPKLITDTIDPIRAERANKVQFVDYEDISDGMNGIEKKSGLDSIAVAGLEYEKNKNELPEYAVDGVEQSGQLPKLNDDSDLLKAKMKEEVDKKIELPTLGETPIQLEKDANLDSWIAKGVWNIGKKALGIKPVVKEVAKSTEQAVATPVVKNMAENVTKKPMGPLGKTLTYGLGVGLPTVGVGSGAVQAYTKPLEENLGAEIGTQIGGDIGAPIGGEIKMGSENKIIVFPKIKDITI